MAETLIRNECSCLNCTKTFQLFNQKSHPINNYCSIVEIFQVYADQFEFTNFLCPSTVGWDFTKEIVPFCDICLDSIQDLLRLRTKLTVIQTRIQKLSNTLRARLLDSYTTPPSPSTPHLNKKLSKSKQFHQFRYRAATKFLPVVSLPILEVDTRREVGTDPYLAPTPSSALPSIDSESEPDDELPDELIQAFKQETADLDTSLRIDVPFFTSIAPGLLDVDSHTHTPGQFLNSAFENQNDESLSTEKQNGGPSPTASEPQSGSILCGENSEIDEVTSCKCKMCPLVFGTKSTLKRHVKILHPEEKRKEKQKRKKQKIQTRKEIDVQCNSLRKYRSSKCYTPGTKARHKYSRQKRSTLEKIRKKKDTSQKKIVKPRRAGWVQKSSDGREWIGDIELLTVDPQRYKCGKCAEKSIFYKTKANLRLHINKAHLKVRKIFFGPPTIRQHLKQLRVDVDEKKTVVNGIELELLDSGEWSCGKCFKTFRKRTTLLNHVRFTHLNLPAYHSKTVSCDVCGKEFKAQSSMEAHRIFHFEEKTFTCDQCGLSYKSLHGLTEHNNRIHEKIVRHSCENCGKGFYALTELTTHIRIYHEKKPPPVPLICACGRQFTLARGLSRHSKKCNVLK